ncbi:MAG: CPBP family intramembrane metalloprotease, partial [Anaeroplasmataceae bacterium]|nr:CPBP family intramembrane metalloprotease [Anaeroplasmataceae bacterium]
VYLLSFIVVAFFMRNYLREDAKGLILDYKKLAWLIPLCAGVGFGIAYLVDYGIGNAIHQVSANQSSIEVLIKNGGGVWMFFAVVIFAPIVEELIYRKAIFEYLKKFPIALSYVVSILLFTFPHMITTFMEESYTVSEKFLLCIPYLLSGLSLCITYHLCKKNIYASWFFHLVNNLISFILVCM